MARGRQSSTTPATELNVPAARRLLETYTGLAQRGAHLFGDLLSDATPKQWAHYPDDDALDHASGFQWFYHSHAPEEQTQTSEHGHIHLFARRRLWSRRLRSTREQKFASLAEGMSMAPNTRHLLGIGFDAKGVPMSIFTVNSWVTGDLMLSAGLTSELLDGLRLDTGHAAIDAVIQSVLAMHRAEIRQLLQRRDEVLFGREGDVLADHGLEVLSEIKIDVDAKLECIA